MKRSGERVVGATRRTGEAGGPGKGGGDFSGTGPFGFRDFRGRFLGIGITLQICITILMQSPYRRIGNIYIYIYSLTGQGERGQ